MITPEMANALYYGQNELLREIRKLNERLGFDEAHDKIAAIEGEIDRLTKYVERLKRERVEG